MTDTKIIATSAAEGAFGFDCNTIVRPNDAAAFVAAGYKFAIRYVPRVGALPHDITSAELRMLLNAGLGVMLVQHVERDSPPWWTPTEAKGMAYGERAAEYAASAEPQRRSVPGDSRPLHEATRRARPVHAAEGGHARDRCGHRPRRQPRRTADARCAIHHSSGIIQ
jgi:hypothetical protein